MEKRKLDRKDERKTNKNRKIGENFSADYFIKVTEECGAFIQDQEQPILTVEPAVFIRNLNLKLENNIDKMRNIYEYVEGFKENTENLDVLHKYCSGGNKAIARVITGAGGILGDKVATYIANRALEAAITDDIISFTNIMTPLLLAECHTEQFASAIVTLIESAGPKTTRELLTVLPEIITRSDRESSRLVADAVSELLSMVAADSERESLIPAVLSCLACFKLTPECRIKTRQAALSLLKSSASPTFYNTIIDFLFTDSVTDLENSESVAALRLDLDWRGFGGETEIASGQALVCLALRNAITRSKKLAATWLKAVASAETPEPFDPVILLILRSTSPSRERPIEALFAKKAKSGLFSSELLRQTFERYGPMLRLHTKDWSETTRRLLGSPEPKIADFAETWSRMAFSRFEDCRRSMIFELSKRDCGEDEAAARINLLMRIADDGLASLKDHSFQLLSLADHFDECSDRAKTAFDLVCRLAFADDDSKIRDDVRMMIAKRLSSSRMTVKSCGILGAAAAIKYLVGRKSSNASVIDSQKEFSQISDLPEGPARDAASLLELALKCSSKFPDVLILFYDELSSSLRSVECWDLSFLNWLSLTFTNDFQTHVIVDADAITPSVKGVKVAVKYCLNSVEEAEDQIALNIAELVLDDDKVSSFDIRLLPSLFRLMRIAYAKLNNGDLSDIDALLGCGVILPDIDFESKLEDYDPHQSRLILDCYCYCLNWFRELVEAFSSIPETFLRKRVIERLNACAYFQQFVGSTIDHLKLTEYKPPKCSQIFVSGSKSDYKTILKDIKKKKPTKTKTKKTKEIADVETQAIEGGINKSFASQDTSAGEKGLSSQILRRIGIDCFNLLGENMSTDVVNYADLLSCSDFNMCTLHYLLEEIVPKLSALFEEPHSFPFKKQSKIIISPVDKNCLVDDFINILPKICANLEKIAVCVQNKLDECNGIRDVPELYTEHLLLSQFCFAACFQMLKLFFSQLASENNQSKLKGVLKTIALLRDSNSKKILIKDLILEAMLYFLRYKEWCIQLSSGVNLLSLLNTLAGLSDAAAYKYAHQLSSEFLSMIWFDPFGIPEKGLQYNQNLNILLHSYFAHPKIKDIKAMLFELKDQVPKLKSNSHVLSNMQSINKQNFTLLYRAIYNGLYEAVKYETNQGISDKQHLDIWSDVALSLKYLIEILKSQETRNNLLTFLKKSVPLFKLFLSQGMPMLTLKLRDDPDSVVDILKLLQYSTRFLQTLNCHSRLKKDTSFMSYQPQMKMILETLIYKVKAALIANDCSEAFWMGSLKNKNLQGEIISTQETIETDDGVDGDNQLPEDDSTSSEIDDFDADDKSVSNVF